ncbi:MAG: molybdenum cofactor synthesis domain-containing protein [Gammaproteobacteria bacterium]|jgi:molybdenum cofactor synthesis domain-containing protein
MSNEAIVSACVLIIGNEILSGRTQDVNLAHIAVQLNEHGVQVREARVIPDIEDVIVDALNECRTKFDYVFTTGGIGPTHDDITSDCVAKAFGRELYVNQEIADLIGQREASPEVMASRMRMARLPQGAELIRNPFGPAGFQVENVYVMAGIPRVMHEMLKTALPTLKGKKPVRSRTVSAYTSESQVAKPLGELQDANPSVDIGSYPFSRNDRYGTSLVVRGTDEAALDALIVTLRTLITDAGGELVED